MLRNVSTLVIAVALLAGCNNTVDTTECSSGALYEGDDEGGALMYPGQDCITCHASGEGEGPEFTAAGTVMGAYPDIDDCLGVDGVTVTITDADAVVHTMTTNASGNFYTTETIAMPYTVVMSKGTFTRAMTAEQSDGNCATCHTDVGAAGAPGRIIAPDASSTP